MFPNQALQSFTDRPCPWFWIRVKTTLGCCLGRQPCAAGMAEAGLPASLARVSCWNSIAEKAEGQCVCTCICVRQIARGVHLTPTAVDWNAVRLWWLATLGVSLSTVKFWSRGRIRIFLDPPPSAAVDTGVLCQTALYEFATPELGPLTLFFCAFLGSGIINNF